MAGFNQDRYDNCSVLYAYPSDPASTQEVLQNILKAVELFEDDSVREALSSFFEVDLIETKLFLNHDFLSDPKKKEGDRFFSSLNWSRPSDVKKLLRFGDLSQVESQQVSIYAWIAFLEFVCFLFLLKVEGKHISWSIYLLAKKHGRIEAKFDSCKTIFAGLNGELENVLKLLNGELGFGLSSTDTSVPSTSSSSSSSSNPQTSNQNVDAVVTKDVFMQVFRLYVNKALFSLVETLGTLLLKDIGTLENPIETNWTKSSEFNVEVELDNLQRLEKRIDVLELCIAETATEIRISLDEVARLGSKHKKLLNEKSENFQDAILQNYLQKEFQEIEREVERERESSLVSLRQIAMRIERKIELAARVQGNKTLKLQNSLTVVSLAIGFGGMVAGFFGMNFFDTESWGSPSKSEWWGMVTILATFVGLCVFLVFSLRWLHRKFPVAIFPQQRDSPQAADTARIPASFRV